MTTDARRQGRGGLLSTEGDTMNEMMAQYLLLLIAWWMR
jgi:hypothetical protein